MDDSFALMAALADVCREVRERAGVQRPEIAVLIGRGQPTVERFERAETFPRGRHLDQLVNAYAHATGSTPASIWKAAIKRAEEPTTADPDLVKGLQAAKRLGQNQTKRRASG